MIVLSTPGPTTNWRAVVVFGVGLIGEAVTRAIESHSDLRRAAYALSWDDSRLRHEQLSALERLLLGSFSADRGGIEPNHAPQLDLVWSAGHAGFAATAEQVAIELASFQDVLLCAERLAMRDVGWNVRLSMIGSAGGLFEGQRVVDRSSVPAPRRPYGQLKAEQEDVLRKTTAPLTSRVYRLSSVYGSISPQRRRGLIPTLILNGIRGRETLITGHMDTLRDFVFVEDVARFLARDLERTAQTSLHDTVIIASTKPSSLFEIQRRVEDVLRKRIFVSYSSRASNREDITFSANVVPPTWQASDLLETLHGIYRHAVSGGAAFDRAFAPGAPFG